MNPVGFLLRLIPVPKLPDPPAPKPKYLSVVSESDDEEETMDDIGGAAKHESGLIVVEELPTHKPQRL